jgi:hypothetical protein
MAQGDVVFFDQFLYNLSRGPDIGHDFGATPNVVKVALIRSTVTPDATTTDPCWGTGGITNFSLNEVTVAGDYTTGGNTCATPSVALVGGLVEFDWGDPAPWATGTDTDAKWGIIYDDTTANKNCIGFIDLGTAFDMSSGTLTITFGTPVATLNQA